MGIADSDGLSPDDIDSAAIPDGAEVANELEVFDYGAVDAVMSDTGRNWRRMDDHESDESDSDEDMDMDEDETESGDEPCVEPSGLHAGDELGESWERALAAIGEPVH
jgi:hypothetical protein